MRSCRIWWISSRSSSEKLSISPDFVAFMVGRVARVFGEETRLPTRRDRVLWVATCRRPSEWSVQVVAVRVRAGPASLAGERVLWTLLIYIYLKQWI